MPTSNDKKSTGCGTLIVVSLIFGVLVVTCIRQNSGRASAPTPTPAPPAPISRAEPYSYSIVGRRDISYLNTPRMVFEVRLDSADLPTEERMKETARLIWLPEASRLKALTVFMIFGEIEDFSSGAYGIANFTQNGLTEFRINENPLTILRLKKSGAFDGLEQSKP